MQPDFSVFLPGDPVPYFTRPCGGNPNYVFDTAAGRYIVLCFYGSSTLPAAKAALALLKKAGDLFDDHKISFFGVSMDPKDETRKNLPSRVPGIRHFWDFNGEITRLYRMIKTPGDMSGFRPAWLILDPNLRVRARVEMRGEDGGRHEVEAILRALPSVEQAPGLTTMPPVLLIPQVFEPDFCRHLIGLYETNGGEDSGVMKQIGGKTVGVMDYAHKRRSDFLIEDAELQRELQVRIVRRIAHEIYKVHQFRITRMERYLVGCYDAATGGHFRAHRDNTTAGTAHRRFAVSINLNDDFSGGEVSFPEYGSRGFKMPAGGAVVFSCSLLHAVSPVTEGRRFAFLPFVYDEAAAAVRQRNLDSLNPANPVTAENAAVS